MERSQYWKDLTWRHPAWDLVRYFRALRGNKNKDAFLKELSDNKALSLESKTLPIHDDVISIFFEYLDIESSLFDEAAQALRSEDEALSYCRNNDFLVGTTKTQSKDHHQSSKAMVSCVTGLAQNVCDSKKLTLDSDPQNRCVWLNDNKLHVTSRNLDGAIPGLVNPAIIWEIKEYWGKTKGGSKMSDAVYECQLVGRELREYEEKTRTTVLHLVFLDGKEQWSHRKSDLRRFVDLTCQGLIDHLIIGKQIETEWEEILNKVL